MPLCPLCSAEVPAEVLEEHLAEELSYAPLRCGLCPTAFYTHSAAQLHFAKRRSPHPGAKALILEKADAALEARLDELLSQALGKDGDDDSELKPPEDHQSVAIANPPGKPLGDEAAFKHDPSRSSDQPSASLSLVSSHSSELASPASPDVSAESLSGQGEAVDASEDLVSLFADQTQREIDQKEEDTSEEILSLSPEDARQDADSKDEHQTADLPREVVGFVQQRVEANFVPHSREPKAKTPTKSRRFTCALCKASVAKLYLNEHVATKHIRASLWKCSKCSYTNHHWSNTIGLKEHLSRKHQLKLTLEFKKHFVDLRDQHVEQMKALKKECFGEMLNSERMFDVCSRGVIVSLSSSAGSSVSVSADGTLCKLCQKSVSETELRNHILLEHIKAPGFRCSVCGLEVPYWKAEFKQMGRHAETRHPGRGLWQTLFEDLRQPLYPQLKAFLRQCFGLEARGEAQEVNNVTHGLMNKILTRHRKAEEEKGQAEEPTPEVHEALPDEPSKESNSGLRCKCANRLPPQDGFRIQERMEDHIWYQHAPFGGVNRWRCRVCRATMRAGSLARHAEKTHGVSEALGRRVGWRRVYEDMATEEERIELKSLVAENFGLWASAEDGTTSDLELRDYESLSLKNKQRLHQQRRYAPKLDEARNPINAEDCLKIHAVSQPWSECAECGRLVALSDRRRHVAQDHLNHVFYRCTRCRQPVRAHCAKTLREPLQAHLRTEHGVAVDLVRLIRLPKDASDSYVGRRVDESAVGERRLDGAMAACFGDAASAAESPPRSLGLVPVLTKDQWPKGLPLPKRAEGSRGKGQA